MTRLRKRRQPDKEILEKLRKKKIYFCCAVCRNPIIKREDIIDVVLSNPRKKVEPTWQQTWICKKCCKKTFRSLGRNLVIL